MQSLPLVGPEAFYLGDTSIEAKWGTFLKRLDTWRIYALTSTQECDTLLTRQLRADPDELLAEAGRFWND